MMRTALSIVLISMLTAPANAEDAPASLEISGVVVDVQDRPVKNARIRSWLENPRIVSPTRRVGNEKTTADDGSFAYPGFPPIRPIHRQIMGVRFQDGDGPAVVELTIKGYPGYEAGIREGDEFVSFSGKPIKRKEDLSEAIKATTEDTNIVVVRRGGVETTINVTLRNAPHMGKLEFSAEGHQSYTVPDIYDLTPEQRKSLRIVLAKAGESPTRPPLPK